MSYNVRGCAKYGGSTIGSEATYCRRIWESTAPIHQFIENGRGANRTPAVVGSELFDRVSTFQA